MKRTSSITRAAQTGTNRVLLGKAKKPFFFNQTRGLDNRQVQELIELLHGQHFEPLANKVKLLNQSSIADCQQQVGRLLFEHCFNRNRRHQLIQIIESGLVDINVRLDNYGRTLLHRAAYNLDVELVQILIEHHINIKLRDYAGNTALHVAIQSYRNGAVIFGEGPDVVRNITEIVRSLLEADLSLQKERCKRKRIRFSQSDEPVAQSCQALPNKIKHTSSGSPEPATSLSQLEPTPNLCHISQNIDISNTSEAQSHDNKNHTIDPILLEDPTSSLIDTKNAFGRTALHYCVLVIGEKHLDHFVNLLISYGADTDAVDCRLKTPLHCLVKRPGVGAIRQKCLSIAHLIHNGCDDLGLAIDPQTVSSDSFIKEMEENRAQNTQLRVDDLIEPIFTRTTFVRVPSLKHLTRLCLVRLNDQDKRLGRQTQFELPPSTPDSLTTYINRKILDQSELY